MSGRNLPTLPFPTSSRQRTAMKNGADSLRVNCSLSPGQRGERRLDFGLRLIEGCRRRVAIDIGEAEIAQAASREDMDVKVGNLEPGDDHAGTVSVERPGDGLAD